jgi:NitT/TauT family transport system substrate-binding protein
MGILGIRDMGIREITRIGRAGFIAAILTAAFIGGAHAQSNVRFSLDGKIDGLAAPFLFGIDRGYFRGEQLNVTIDPAAEPAEPITRVATGLYDMGIADINLLIKYRDQNPNSPVMAVFIVYNKPAYAVVGRKSRGVTKPKELEGKKLGAPVADIAFSHWKLFAKVNEIDLSKVIIENVGFPVREPLLQNGQVDAVTGFSYSVLPNLKFMGLQADDIVPLLMADYGVKLYGNVIIVNPKFMAEKPDVVKGFLQAYAKSLRESSRNPIQAVESALRRNDTALKEVELDRLRIVLKENVITPEVKAHGLGAVDFARLDLAIEQLGLTSELKTKLKAADIFDASMLPSPALRKVF